VLLQHDVQVNAQGGKYGNALRAAICQRQKSVVQLLLEAGAVLGNDWKNDWGYTWAKRNSVLLDESRSDQDREDYRTILAILEEWHTK
jgi:hypothetical protein